MITKDNYTEENSKAVDSWVKTGWIWSRPITHEEYLNAKGVQVFDNIESSTQSE